MATDTSEAIARRLQVTTGTVIAVGSLLVAAMSFVRLVSESVPPMEAFSRAHVWTLVAYAVVGGVTAVMRSPVARSIHLGILFLVSVASAATVEPGDLTALVFFGLFLAYTLVYLPASRRRYWVFTLSVPLFATTWAVGLSLIARDSVYALIVSFLAGATATVLVLALLQAARSMQASQKDLLRHLVDESTADLAEALNDSNRLLAHNTLLLKEVHHRTKNNLQVIASLLSIRQDDATCDDSERAIETARNQVYVMAMVHDMFHHSASSTDVSLGTLLRNAGDLWLRHGVIDGIRVETPAVDDLPVSMDFAIPLALALNELVEYAAQGVPSTVDSGVLEGTLADDNQTIQVRLANCDPGPDLPGAAETALQIARRLVEQIDGRLFRDPADGEEGRGGWMIRTSRTVAQPVADAID